MNFQRKAVKSNQICQATQGDFQLVEERKNIQSTSSKRRLNDVEVSTVGKPNLLPATL
jgi:hypothetical protein